MTETDDQKNYGIFNTSAGRTLTKRLQNEGRNVLEFTPFIIVKKQFNADEIKLLDDLLSFDWLIFTHPAAAQIFLEIIKSKNIDLYDLDEIRIGVLGDLVSDILRFEQIHTDLIFKVADNPVFLLDDFSSHESENISKKVLIISGISDLPFGTKSFNESRFVFSFLEVYQIERVESADYARQKALINGGAVDEFVVTSPDDLLFLKQIYRGKGNFADTFDFRLSAADAGLVRFLKDNNLTAGLLK